MIGHDLARLVGAILNDTYCEWPEGRAILGILHKRFPFHHPVFRFARFKPGDAVRTKNIHPTTHTRLPRYARGKLGTVEAVRGCHVFPDTAALGAGENPQWLYNVVFDARELWGEEADPAIKVSIEAFEPYLAPA